MKNQLQHLKINAYRNYLRPLLVFAVAAQLSLIAEPAAEADDPFLNGEQLELDSFLRKVLEHNIGLRIERINPANARDQIQVARSIFDLRLESRYNYIERRAVTGSGLTPQFSIVPPIPNITDPTVKTFIESPIGQWILDRLGGEGTSVGGTGAVTSPRVDSQQFSVGTSKLFSPGTIVSLNSNITRTFANAAGTNPDYSSDIGLSIRQPLLRGAWQTVNLAPLARAKIGGEQAVDRLMDSILDVLSVAEIAYWNLSHARARRDFFASSLDLSKSILEESKVRESLGVVTQLEVLQADAEVISREEELILAELQIDDAVDRLIRVSGGDFDQMFWQSEFGVAPLPESTVEPESLSVVGIRAAQADMRARAQERQIEIQRLTRLLAADQTRPDFDFTFGLQGFGRDRSGTSSYRETWSGDAYNMNAGVQLSMPWGFREARAQERQAGRNLQREEWILADLRREQSFLVRETWRQLSSGLKRIEVTRAAVRLNEEGFEQARARFATGASAYRRVLEAQRDLDQAKVRYLSAVIETLRAEIRLARLDGSLLERNGFEWDDDVLRINPSAQR